MSSLQAVMNQGLDSTGAENISTEERPLSIDDRIDNLIYNCWSTLTSSFSLVGSTAGFCVRYLMTQVDQNETYINDVVQVVLTEGKAIAKDTFTKACPILVNQGIQHFLLSKNDPYVTTISGLGFFITGVVIYRNLNNRSEKTIRVHKPSKFIDYSNTGVLAAAKGNVELLWKTFAVGLMLFGTYRLYGGVSDIFYPPQVLECRMITYKVHSCPESREILEKVNRRYNTQIKFAQAIPGINDNFEAKAETNKLGTMILVNSLKPPQETFKHAYFELFKMYNEDASKQIFFTAEEGQLASKEYCQALFLNTLKLQREISSTVFKCSAQGKIFTHADAYMPESMYLAVEAKMKSYEPTPILLPSVSYTDFAKLQDSENEKRYFMEEVWPRNEKAMLNDPLCQAWGQKYKKPFCKQNPTSKDCY